MTENHSSCIRFSDARICRYCYCCSIIKNGTTKTGKQQYFCKNCRKRFIAFYTYQAYRDNINALIIRFTKEGLGIRSTARLLSISTTTVLKRITAIADHMVPPKISFGQSYELDELRFFIGSKRNPMWLAYAFQKTTKQIVRFHVGKRTNKTLSHVIKTLIHSRPEKIYTDQLRNYQFLIPKAIHSTRRFGTNSIERSNLTIRTHLKRFNRRSICFTKSIHILNAVLKIYFWDTTYIR
ncbi:IS1 family transposase [Chryseobacterium camelliae]|uniref:IS1 family transposase n=1 Tax=Chryseobacterium camelliae TaxID=1265445 RepID=UPI002864C6BC|nr:IS1 family transposase [Chryseobacterium camelliae]MDR6515931.1 IS1 family transposase/transposase-like protein [Chryseobacterium camelliae]